MSDDEDILEPEPASMAWLLTFADLISLLITFFVLLFSMKTVDQSRWDLVYGSLSGVFAEKEAVVFVRPEEFKTAETIQSSNADDLQYLENILRQSFKDEPLLESMETRYDEATDVLRLSLPGIVFYNKGNSKLSAKGRVAITKLADKLRHLDNKIQVVGHTDIDFQRTLDYPTSWELAMERAINVTRILYKRGVPAPIRAFSNGQVGPSAEPGHVVEVLIYGVGQ